MTSSDHAHGNGTHLARACAGVGPQSACTVSGTVSDHPGSVPPDEREFLAAGFGAELKRLRKAAELSQARLGGLAGLRGDHVGRLERGTRRPSVAAVKAVCRILIPEGEREAAESRLAVLAGESLREGAWRKKQAKDNKHRRAALASAKKAHRRLAATIRAKEARGELVAGNLRSMSDRLGETVSRLQAEKKSNLAGINGISPRRKGPQRWESPRGGSQKDIRAWLNSLMSEPFGDGDDDDAG